MDAQVDNRLGDSISVSLDAGMTWNTLPGFILPVDPNIVSPAKATWQVKFSKQTMPQTPTRATLVRSSKIFGTYRCVADEIEQDAGYWVFKLQVAKIDG